MFFSPIPLLLFTSLFKSIKEKRFLKIQSIDLCFHIGFSFLICHIRFMNDMITPNNLKDFTCQGICNYNVNDILTLYFFHTEYVYY